MKTPLYSLVLTVALTVAPFSVCAQDKSSDLLASKAESTTPQLIRTQVECVEMSLEQMTKLL